MTGKVKNKEYPALFRGVLENIARFNAPELQKKRIEELTFPRRYFYPSLNTIAYTKGCSMPVSESVASRVMCLPLYVGLEEKDLEKIIILINQ
ncbi:hypothetical protein MASR1M65_18650 [Saprospiraceae bacterium]